jgi:Zn-finger nucleic acid-binding protein
LLHQDNDKNRTCPSCNGGLTLLEIAGADVAACDGGCGGLWFSRACQKKLRTQPPGGGRALLAVKSGEGVRLFRGPCPACPQCRTTLLLRHFFDPALDLEVDQCARCGGFWMEAGMLGRGAQASLSAEERAARYFAEIYARCIAAMDVGNPEVREAANALVRILGWISPRPFMPGEAPWWLERR